MSVSRGSDSAALGTPTDLSPANVKAIAALNPLVADAFALYLKTKNFHWHVSGPHFRDYHLMLDEQGDQIFAMTDELAERVRKVGGTTLRSIGHISKLQRITDNDAEFVAPADMLRELMEDNKAFTVSMREAHALADENNDSATTSLLENFIDETEKRTWFLFEAARMTHQPNGCWRAPAVPAASPEKFFHPSASVPLLKFSSEAVRKKRDDAHLATFPWWGNGREHGRPVAQLPG
jgi:starvation-inducible DNA-binding protein